MLSSLSICVQIYNMFAAVLILFAMKVFINDAFNASESANFSASISLLFWNFGGLFSTVIPMWIALFASHALLLPLMWTWRLGRIGDRLYAALYTLHQLSFIVAFGYAIERLHLPVASSLILLCEQVRMVMKAHSFWRETLRIKYATGDLMPKGNNTHQSKSVENCTFLPTFRAQLDQFLLFHFVPTLIYRNVYPRTRHIRWSFVATCLIEVIGCIFYLYVIFTGCVSEFKAMAAQPGDLKALSVSLFNVSQTHAPKEREEG